MIYCAGMAPSRKWTGSERLALKMPNRQVFVMVGEIDWIESERNYVRVHAGDRSFTVRATLSDLENRLAGSMFVRIQRSSIINAERVEEIRRVGRDYEVVLRGGTTRLMVGRPYVARLEAALGEICA